MFKNILLLFACASILLYPENLFGQEKGRDSLHKGRLALVISTEAVAYTGALFVLNEFWYKYNDHSNFHFYNDNEGWLQIDKMGHAYAAYTQSYWGLKMMQWAGVERKKAIWFGGGLGIIMQTPIEILDGYSEAWGASWGDLIANTSGSALVISQQLAWDEQRVHMKFSYSPSPYTKYRPAYFGTTVTENFIRDYNGHTYCHAGYSKAGIDCSGFVSKIYKEVFDVDLTHSSSAMIYQMHTLVKKSELQQGDILFFRIHGKRISHVGIYLGDHKFVHASSYRGIVVDDLRTPYYKKSVLHSRPPKV